MKLDNKFSVPVDPDQVWKILLNVPRIVSCVPGAELVSQEGEGAYKGRISVSLGPVKLKFLGAVTFSAVNDATRTAVVNAKGADQQGRGTAGAVTEIKVVGDQGGATVLLQTDLQLSGLIAQYGRASGVIVVTSNQMTEQFAMALKEQLLRDRGLSPDLSVRATDITAAKAPPVPVKPMSLLSILWRALLTKLGLKSNTHNAHSGLCP